MSTPAPVLSSSSSTPASRLRDAVRTLLAEARRGERQPAFIELLALHGVCMERGLYDCTADIRQYIAEASHLAHLKPLVTR
jgi:hypothetical protein